MTANIAASVRARLANKSRESQRPFQEMLQYYGLERFLYRFSRTEHRDRFLLKGALMLRVWEAPGVVGVPPPTRSSPTTDQARSLETPRTVVSDNCAMRSPITTSVPQARCSWAGLSGKPVMVKPHEL